MESLDQACEGVVPKVRDGFPVAVDGPICEASPDALAADALPADALPDALAADAIPDALVADYTLDVADVYATDGWEEFLFLLTCTGKITAVHR